MSHPGAGDAPHQHRSYAPESVSCAVLTVSDSRTLEDDTSGQRICAELEKAGHRVRERSIVPDDADEVRRAVLRGIDAPTSTRSW